MEGVLNITLLQNGKVMRYAPDAVASTTHVPLAIVDELQPGTEIFVPSRPKGRGP